MRILTNKLISVVMLLLTGLCSARSEVLNYDSIIKEYSKKNIEDITATGYKNLENGKYEEALTLYNIAITLPGDTTRQKTKREFIKAMNNIGYIYLFDRHNPEKAYPYFLQAREMAEREGHSDLLAAILDNIAKVHDDFGDHDKAIDLYSHAMSEAVKIESEISPVIQLMVFNDLINCAVAHDMTERLGPGLAEFSTLPEYELPMSRYSVRMCEGLRALTEGDTVKALSYVKEAGKLIDSRVDYRRNVTDHLLTVATLYHMRSMEDSARKYLDMALANARQYNLTDKLPRIYRGMAEVENALGHSDNSRRMMLQAYQADDSLHSSKTYATLNGLENANRVDGLNIKLKEATIRQRHRTNVIWILASAVLLIAVLLANIILRNRKLSASLRELVARHQASISTEEANSRLRQEYEETIKALRTEMEGLRQESQSTDDPSHKKMSLPVDDNERLRIIGKVNSVFSNDPEIFESDFSLERLADMSGTKPRYLSALLNETMGKTFSQLLSEARIKKACEILLSPAFRKTKTIESIALEVGYKSRTHFTSVFKKTTGVTPLQYVDMAQ